MLRSIIADSLHFADAHIINLEWYITELAACFINVYQMKNLDKYANLQES